MTTMSESYLQALKILGDIEGGYSMDPDDPGGETLLGWARKFHPSAPFWPKVDAYKKQYGGATKECIKVMLADAEIHEMSKMRYKELFWDIFDGDDLPFSLALELFESSVNLGAPGGVKLLQSVLNALNYENKFGADLKTPYDGIFGQNSRGRFQAMIKAGYAKSIQFAVNAEQGHYYLTRTEANKDKRKFYKGWIQQRCGAVYMENPKQ